VASNRVLERLGFRLEGVKRESYWVEDVVTDDAIWGLLARDWRA
jgi:aminoglycoside 6'-N-acetyltransferase